MNNLGMSKHRMKQYNRTQILRYLKETHGATKSQTAQWLGLTRASITMLIDEMVEEGILSPPKDDKKRGGKYTISANHAFVLGAVLHPQGITMGLSNLAGELLEKREVTFGTLFSVQELVQQLVRLTDLLLTETGLPKEKLLGIGLISRLAKEPFMQELIEEWQILTSLPIFTLPYISAIVMAALGFLKPNNLTNQQRILGLSISDSFSSVWMQPNCNTEDLISPPLRPYLLPESLEENYPLQLTSCYRNLFAYTRAPSHPTALTIQSDAALWHNRVQAFVRPLRHTLSLLSCLVPLDKIVLHLPDLPHNLMEALLNQPPTSLRQSWMVLPNHEWMDLLAGCAIAIRRFFYENLGEE